MLRIALFGTVSLRFGERDIPVKSQKLRAIIGYLALSDSPRETRERLVGLLWSESGETHARAALRQVIREFRGLPSVTEADGPYIDSREIGFRRDGIETDVGAVLRAAEADQVHPLLLERRHLPDELLAGLEDLDPSFRTWLLAKRRTLHDRLQRALETALADDTRTLPAQGQIAQAILNLDATHEAACRRLMRVRATAGDTAGALRTYKELWDLLDEDYGMEPSMATQNLVADIKNGLLEPTAPDEPPLPLPAFAAAREQAASQPALPPSIHGQGRHLWLAVPPVIARDINPDNDYMVLEFRLHLIASLVRFRELRVTDAPVPVPAETNRVAGEHYELQMMSHQAGQVMHFMVILKQMDGLYLWCDEFELSMENWFESQRRIVQRTAMAFNVHLSAERLRRFSNQPDVSLGVYDRWLRSQTRALTFDPRYWKDLDRQVLDVIQAAPDFGPAHGTLADMQNITHIVHPGVFRTRERERQAREHARRAVQLDPLNARAHLCLAWSHAMAKHYDQARLHSEVAQELNPNDSWTVISVALLLAFCGQCDTAERLAAQALDIALAPSQTHWIYQSIIQFLAGHYEAALESTMHCHDIRTPAWRAAALAQLGRTDEAGSSAAQFLMRARSNWFGADPSSDEKITQWMLHLFPISHRDDWERLRGGLRLSGLPTGAMEHHAW